MTEGVGYRGLLSRVGFLLVSASEREGGAYVSLVGDSGSCAMSVYVSGSVEMSLGGREEAFEDLEAAKEGRGRGPVRRPS